MLETFKRFIQTLPPEYLLGTFFGTLVAFGIFIHFIKQQIQEESRYIASNILNNEASINSYASDLEKKVKPDTYFYKEYLHSTLDFVEKHLGKLKLFSYKTWEKHVTYSLIYSVFFFYLIWLFGGSRTIGTLNFFPNENRLIVSLFLIFEIITLYFTFYKTEQVINFLSRYVPLFSQLSNTWKEILVVGVGVVVVVGVVVGVVGVVVGGGVGGGGVVVNPTTILYLLFFLILPFINSIFDYLSMYFSRFFAYKILDTHKKWKVFLDVILDTLIAIALLIALATTLFYVLEYTNGFIDDEKLKIPIEFYKTELLTNPFSKDVLWITLMFASTLIPTLAHLLMGLYSLIALYVVKPHLQKLADALIELNKNDENSYKKHLIAKELVLHEQSLMLKIYMFIGIGILFGFLLSAVALLIKIGFNIF